MDDQDVCYCGHIRDEHIDGHRECDVTDCRCIAFEYDQEDTE